MSPSSTSMRVDWNEVKIRVLFVHTTMVCEKN